MKAPLRWLRVVAPALMFATLVPSQAFAQKVLLVAGEDPALVAEVQSKLTATGMFTQVDVADGLQTTAPDLTGYDAVLTWSDAPYGGPDALGNALADFVDHGHGVVQA